ncbi:Ig-like domain-containing protein [Cohnella lubricantis]|nr:Ig-like domain-containing protein [Cohnella lubricantis]
MDVNVTFKGTITQTSHTNPLLSLRIDPTSKTLNVGEQQQFTVYGKYSSGEKVIPNSNLIWSSDQNSNAPVSSGGLVIGTKVTTTDAHITATYKPDPTKKVTATVKVVENQPPYAEINWIDPDTGDPVSQVQLGKTLNLKAYPVSDPDSDPVHIVGWDFSSSDFLSSWRAAHPSNGYNLNGIEMTEEGTFDVSLTVADNKGSEYTAWASVDVISADPVAKISGPTRIKEGRPMPSPIDGSRSYSPIGAEIVTYEWTGKQDSYPTPGEYTITLRVQDSAGRWSNTAEHHLTVVPDEAPIGMLFVPPEETRLGTVHVQSAAYSLDGDTIVSHQLERKYDAANDGFSNDAWTVLQTGNSASYDFTPDKVGKYLFRETVCEDYGKCGNSDGQPESERTVNVINLAPSIDVQTSSTVQEPPEETILSMSDLYNNGRFYNLSSGSVGEKSSWELVGGVLKSKVKQQLYNNTNTITKSNILSIYWYNMSGFGLSNILNTPFLSPQGSLTASSYSDSIGSLLSYNANKSRWVADETYTYVTDRSGTLLAIDHSNNSTKWSFAPPNGVVTSSSSSNSNPYDEIILTHGDYIYLLAERSDISGLDIYKLERSTGRSIKQVYIPHTRYGSDGLDGRLWEFPQGFYFLTSDWIDTTPNSSTLTAESSYASYLYDWDLNQLAFWESGYGRDTPMEARYMFFGFDDTTSTDFSVTSTSNGQICIWDMQSRTQTKCAYLPISNNSRDKMGYYQFLGTDHEGNLIFYDKDLAAINQVNLTQSVDSVKDQALAKLSPDGTVTRASKMGAIVPLSSLINSWSIFRSGAYPGGGLYSYAAMKVLGMDSNDHIWVQATDRNDAAKNAIAVEDTNGNVLSTFYPFANAQVPYSNVESFVIVSDGLVTLFGIDSTTDSTKPRIYYSVINPKDFSIVTSGEISGILDRYQVGTSYFTFDNTNSSGFVPFGDQTYLFRAAFRYKNPSTAKITYQNKSYILKSTATPTNQRLIEIGSDTPDLITGTTSISSSQELRVSLKASAPDPEKGTGVAFRIQDDRNYYSLEWENNELRLKKTVNGSASVVQSKSYPMNTNQTYAVEIKPVSGGFSVYVNKILQFTASESGWTSGKYGIINRGQQGVSFLGASTVASSGEPGGVISGVALVGEPITYDITFDDPESDPRLTQFEAWDYSHNPNVFLQPQGLWNGTGTGHTPTPVTSFDKPGEYTFKFRSKDDPNPANRYPSSVFDSYRQLSNEVTGTIRVHRKPVAQFNLTLNTDHSVTISDTSYDPDRYNPSNGSFSTEATGIDYRATRGIVERKWRYMLLGSSGFVDGRPNQLLASGTYTIELAVRDEYGAWSDWATQTVDVQGITGQPPIPGFALSPNPSYRFVPVTINSTASDSQDGGRENLTHAYYIKNLTNGGAESLQSSARTSWDKLFSSLGLFNVRQVVTNSYGLSAEANKTINIVNRKPTADITVPNSADQNNPLLVRELRPEFNWTYTDPDGDPQSQWQLQIHKYDGTVRSDSGAKSGFNLTWTPTANLDDNTSYYAQIRVYDGYDWSDWSPPKYFRIETNKPPAANFQWSPNLVYEGDTVQFIPAVHDPDRDTLQLTYEITSPSGAKRSYQDTKPYPYSASGPSIAMPEPGVWTVTLKVSDGKAPTVAVSKSLNILPLSISGQVRHTDDWEAKRLHYNDKHPDDQRPADWFWAGEAFVLDAQTTDTGASTTKALKVVADAGGGLRKQLAAANAPASNLWSGTLGSTDAGFQLVTLPEGDYIFTFTVTYSNGTVKTSQATIHVADTVDNYLQVHRIQ